MHVINTDPTDVAPSGQLRFAVAASAALCVNFFSAWTVPLQIEEMTARYGFSLGGAGLAATIQMLVLGATMVLASHFILRFRGERIAQCGVLLAIVGFAGASLAKGNPWLFFGSFGIAGIGQGLAGVGGNVLAAAAASPGRIYNAAYGSSILFGAASLLLLPYVHSPFTTVNSVFFACAVGMGICLVALELAHSDTEKASRAVPQGKSAPFTLAMIAPLASVFLLWLSGSAVWAYSEQLGHRISVGERSVGIALSIAAAASIAAPFLIAPLSSRPKLSLPVAIAFACSGIGFVLACTTGNAPLFLSSFFGQAIGQSAVAGLVFIICVRADPTGRLSTLAGSFNLFGSAVGPFAGGLLVSENVLLFAWMCATLCIIAWVAMAWFEYRLRA